MKNIAAFVLILVGLITASCAKQYKYQTSDFALFSEEKIELDLQKKLRRFNEGMYLMEIKAKDTTMFGNYTEWYDLNQGNELKQYAFLVFLDDYRVYYYTVFDDQLVDSVRLLTSSKDCYEPVKNINERNSNVFDRFNITYANYPYSMRGYYHLKTDIPIYNAFVTKDIRKKYYIDFVELELEKFTAANRKAFISLILLENKTNHEQSLVMTEFRLASSKESDIRVKPTEFNKQGIKFRNILLNETLDFPPTFQFTEKPVFFYWCPCGEDKNCRKDCWNKEREYFNQIDYNKEAQYIRYLCGETVIKEESFEAVPYKSRVKQFLCDKNILEAKKVNFQTW